MDVKSAFLNGYITEPKNMSDVIPSWDSSYENGNYMRFSAASASTMAVMFPNVNYQLLRTSAYWDFGTNYNITLSGYEDETQYGDYIGEYVVMWTFYKENPSDPMNPTRYYIITPIANGGSDVVETTGYTKFKYNMSIEKTYDSSDLTNLTISVNGLLTSASTESARLDKAVFYTTGNKQWKVLSKINGTNLDGDQTNITHKIASVNGQDIFISGNTSAYTPVDIDVRGDWSVSDSTSKNYIKNKPSVTSAVTSASTDSEIPTAKAVYDAIPTVPTSNTAFTNDAGYITVDALSGYAESSAVTEEITAAVSSKQDTLVAGENITISGNVISASGGGTTYSAGRGIDITNDTISFSLPIYDKRNYSISECHDKIYDIPSCSSNYCHLEQSKGGIGYSSHSSHKEGINTIIGNYCYSSHVEGYFSKINDDSAYSHAEGYYTEINNQREHASGSHNVSNKASTTFGDSGNTLFSVGNGTSDNARHNAFEIRQNGDMYLNNGTSDIKLQDYLQIKVAKISQSDYDALVQGGTTDPNTLYIISD